MPGAEKTITVGSDSLAKYFRNIYRFAMGIVGILATVVMMYGGIRWITAGGSPEAISDAKAWITAALTGVLLMLGTYTILYLVNSDLVNFRPVKLEKVEDTPIENINPAAYADTKEELDSRTEKIESLFGSRLVFTKRALFQSEQGFNSTMPLCNDELYITFNLNSSPIASSFPFIS